MMVDYGDEEEERAAVMMMMIIMMMIIIIIIIIIIIMVKGQELCLKHYTNVCTPLLDGRSWLYFWCA